MTNTPGTENIEEKKPPVFELNGKTVDLRKAIPMTVRDWKRLKKDGVDLLAISTGEVDLDGLIKLVVYVCQKANPELTADDLDDMPGPWFTRVAQVVNELGGEVDVPF